MNIAYNGHAVYAWPLVTKKLNNMQKVKFTFKLTSKGMLNNVFFYPEQEDVTILLNANQERKIWTNQEFELLVDDQFEYTLKVFGVSGTEWEAELKVVTESGQSNFLKWKGITGDTRRSISVRTKPVKEQN